MVLIDLGNTNAKVFDGSKVTKLASCEVWGYLSKYADQAVIISSVVPSLTSKIKASYPNVQFVEPADYQLMFNDNGQLASKGADRIIASFGAVKLFGPKVVVCDIGTCVTLDVIADRRYISGFIYPGFIMLENLLTQKIEQLPTPEAGLDCVSTANQIYWANIYGFIGALVKLVEVAMAAEDYQLVITGGSVLKFKEEYGIDIVDHLKQYNPVYHQQLIKVGLEYYIKEKATVS